MIGLVQRKRESLYLTPLPKEPVGDGSGDAGARIVVVPPTSAGRLIQKEFKALKEGTRLPRKDIAQLRGNIAAALLRAANFEGITTRGALHDELENGILYVFRGDPEKYTDLLYEILEETRKALPDEFGDLAQVLIEKAKKSFVGEFPY